MARIYVPEKYHEQQMGKRIWHDQVALSNIVLRAVCKDHGNEWVKATVTAELGWTAPDDEIINGIRDLIKEAAEKMPDKLNKRKKDLGLA